MELADLVSRWIKYACLFGFISTYPNIQLLLETHLDLAPGLCVGQEVLLTADWEGGMGEGDAWEEGWLLRLHSSIGSRT